MVAGPLSPTLTYITPANNADIQVDVQVSNNGENATSLNDVQIREFCTEDAAESDRTYGSSQMVLCSY